MELTLVAVHAGKPEPRLEVPQAQTAHNNFWDFQYLHPEATHMFMWAISDRAIPRSYRMMQGFGVNTYRLVNKDDVSHFVKFHWTPTLGVCSVMWDENLKIGGQDPDFLRKDLAEAIDNGVYPKWKFGIQVLSEDRQDDFDFDILDATKVWPEELVPIRYIGEFELNRNPDEYFPQTEMAAFCTSHIVPGIEMSDDPVLQGRNFSYLDTQISRLGVNFQQLPINRPVCPIMNIHRDGAGQQRIHKGNDPPRRIIAPTRRNWRVSRRGQNHPSSRNTSTRPSCFITHCRRMSAPTSSQLFVSSLTTATTPSSTTVSVSVWPK